MIFPLLPGSSVDCFYAERRKFRIPSRLGLFPAAAAILEAGRAKNDYYPRKQLSF